MENVPKKLPRIRKANFSINEETVLHEEVEKHISVLREKHSSSVTNQEKAKVWNSITEKINSLGVASRTQKEVRDKWRNITSKAKATFTTFRQESRRTGGGPPPKKPCTAIEKVITLYQDSDGFKGIDGGLDTDIIEDDAASVGDGEPETEPEGNYTAIPLSPVVVVNANKPTLQVDKTAQQVKETTQQVTPVSPVVPSSKTKRTSQQDIMDSQVAVLKEQRLLFQEQRVLLKQQLNVEVKKSEKLDLQIKLLTRLNDDNLQTLTNSQMALFSAFTS